MHFGSSLASQIYKALWSVILAAWGQLWNRRAELHSIQLADSVWPFVKGQAEPALSLSVWHEATFSAVALAASGWMQPHSTTVPFCITVWLSLHYVVMDTSRVQKKSFFQDSPPAKEKAMRQHGVCVPLNHHVANMKYLSYCFPPLSVAHPSPSLHIFCCWWWTWRSY